MDELRERIDQLLFSKATKSDFGWLAGIIDGDGNFYIGVEWKGDKVYRVVPVISITNTNVLIFRKMFAMGINPRIFSKKRLEKEGGGLRRRAYVARIYIKDMRLILPRIVGDLAGKRAQAVLMIEALELMKDSKSDAREKRLFALHEGIKALNQKEWPLEAWG